jgi:hypothetical protein
MREGRLLGSERPSLELTIKTGYAVPDAGWHCLSNAFAN